MIFQPASGSAQETPGILEEDLLRKVTRAFGLLAILASLTGIAGNITGIVAISSICPGCKTIALSAALIWIFFGAVFVAGVPYRLPATPARTVLQGCIILVACLATADILAAFFGGRFIVETWSVYAGSLLFGPASTPISPIASALIIVAAAGLLASTSPGFFSPGRSYARGTSALCGILVTVAGFTLCLSYLFGNPLEFTAPVIPIAAISALAAVFIGLALVFAAGSKTFPLRLFVGSSIRARLLRTFVPLTVAITLCQAIVFSAIFAWFSLSNELSIAVSLVIFTLVTAVIVGRLSGELGFTLDAAEQQLAAKNADLDTINKELLVVEEQMRQNVSEISRKELDLRESRELLATDLRSMTLLQKIGMLYIHGGNLRPALSEIVSAAIAITRADFGNIQLVDPATSRLKIIAHQGFPDWWVEYWNTSSMSTGACGTAQKEGGRVIVEDVTKSEIFAGTPELEVHLRAGIRAVQSTPIKGRDGKILGMFSTHFKEPHRPDERQIVMLDLLALQTADIIERAQSGAALQRGMEATSLLADSSRLLMSTENPERVIQNIGERVMQYLDGCVFLNYLLDETDERLRLNASAGISSETEAQMRYLPLGEGVCGRVACDGKLQVISDVAGSDDPATIPIRSFGITAYACYPLVFQDRIIGTLSFGICTRTSFSQEELDLMQAVADRVTSVLARKKIEDTLRGTSQYLENLITYANAPIIVWDPALRILRFNHAFEFLTGMLAETVIGQPLEILFPDQYRETALALIKKTGAGERWESVEIPIRHASGAVKTVLWNSANVYDTDGTTLISTIAQGEDITERKIAEDKLQKTASLLSAALESTADGILVIDNERRITSYNNRFCSMWGIEKRPLEGTEESAVLSTMLPLIADTQAFFSRRDELYAHRNREGYDVITLLDGRVLERYSKPQMIGEDVVGRVWSYRDITERKLAERSLQESMEKFRIVATHIPDQVLVQDADLRYTMVLNPQWGLSEQEMIGNTDYDLFGAEDGENITRQKRQVLESGVAVQFEMPLINVQGEKNYFAVSYVPRHDASGHIDGLIGYFRNVTDTHEANERILAALAEKEILIREIHHRVKNNLQIVSGLLDMTRSRTSDAATSAILTDVMLKIRTMAQIHTRLYESNQAGRVNMGDQIRDMVSTFFTLYGKAGAEISCDMEVGDFTLAVDQAVPCALAINEVLSNSFKHAFAGRRKGIIRVTAQLDDENVHISIEDNGVGIPEGVDPETTSSLGLKLIRSLVQQLHGTVTIRSTGGGTRVVINFPFGEKG